MSTLLLLILGLVLLAFSAIFSGLTIGLFSLSMFELKRKSDMGNPEAQLVYPIRARGNELLVGLLIGNVLVNAALTVVLDNILPGEAAIAGIVTVILATVLITIFGEILPQAFMKQNGLKYGAAIAPYMEYFLNIMHPFSGPLGYILDRTVGVDMPTVYSTDELVRILEEHEESEDSDIEADEINIVRNALNFGDKLVHDVMTPKSVISAIRKEEILSPAVLKELHESGHSRFPVYDGTLDKIAGILYLRDLVDAGTHAETAEKAMKRRVFYVNENQALDHALNAIIRTKHHLFIVINEFKETVGIVTIEDIIEEIMGREIVDEFDQYDDMREVASLEAKKSKHPRSRIIGRKAPTLD